MEMVVGKHAGQSQGVGRMSVDGGALPECEVIHRLHPITPPSRCESLGRVKPELVGLPSKSLAQDSKRRLRFFVQIAGWLHSMVRHGRTQLSLHIDQHDRTTRTPHVVEETYLAGFPRSSPVRATADTVNRLAATSHGIRVSTFLRNESQRRK